MNIKQKKRAQKVLKRWRNFAERERTAKSVWVSDTKWVGMFQYEHKCKYALRKKYGKIN